MQKAISRNTFLLLSKEFFFIKFEITFLTFFIILNDTKHNEVAKYISGFEITFNSVLETEPGMRF